jgi:hypothetical protein
MPVDRVAVNEQGDEKHPLTPPVIVPVHVVSALLRVPTYEMETPSPLQFNDPLTSSERGFSETVPDNALGEHEPCRTLAVTLPWFWVMSTVSANLPPA